MAGAATALALVTGAGTSSAMFVDYLADRAKLRAYAVATRKPAESTRHQKKTAVALPVKTAAAAPVKIASVSKTSKPEPAPSATSVALAAKAAASAGLLPVVTMPEPGRIRPTAEMPVVAEHVATAMPEADPGVDAAGNVEPMFDAGDVDVGDDTFTGAISAPRPADVAAAVPAASEGGEKAAPKPARKSAGRIAQVLKYVNLRSRPADESKVLKVVPAKAKVNVFSCKSWCEVDYRGTRGFIYKRFIDNS